MLSEGDRKTLLCIARETIKAAVTGLAAPKVTAESEALQAPCGAFVTMKNRGRLRGCIGTFVARDPLHQTVCKMAEQAVTQDWRFASDPVTAGELDRIDIEISVLSPLEKVDDPLADIELGRHGIYVQGPYGSGCFLPQVATETGWSKEEFLSHCCAGKAGLPPDAWKSPDVVVSRFEAEVFGEMEEAD
ncbi:MAG: hypothetical protein AMK72_13350 [Planctomycetes bacterium SM23_25]|nr:MAG: hypothetical protein AMK72_13350 [Planctomycetes bacterium SM23_25]